MTRAQRQSGERESPRHVTSDVLPGCAWEGEPKPRLHSLSGCGRGVGGLQVEALRRMLQATEPQGVTPLAECIAAVGQRLWAAAAALVERRRRLFLVIVTDGVPTSALSSRASQVGCLCEVYERRQR